MTALAIVAHLYNMSANLHGGKVEAIYTSKGRPDAEAGMCLLDVERGVAGHILAARVADGHLHRQLALRQTGTDTKPPSE